ncbi:hypothetical protein J3L16_15490 [Alteromonas sp. 5E99-2]|uniref:hypothetical protein n=1 Tax=Alteromonas sp. 5E99-2 TaxID=2817683 RepID=UPI001A994AC8|nr:hypothetical protein [Alteromonas sp. 5E99-2]MBO1257087.1 hypothetical protein [Alteromonas sp. 5E99-2]
MTDFKIVQHLTPDLFKECPVWSEYYDYEELEELSSWGVKKRHIDKLLKIAKKDAAHPYYPINNMLSLPDRMRIFIHVVFKTPSGRSLEGVICNPNPFVIGIFVNEVIELFNPNLPEFWEKAESNLRKVFNIENEAVFPLAYETEYEDSNGTKIQGVYEFGNGA